MSSNNPIEVLRSQSNKDHSIKVSKVPYIKVNYCTKDTLFHSLAVLTNREVIYSLLSSNGFKEINKGTYTESIWSDGEFVIKFFKEDKYNKNPLFPGYFDYKLFSMIDENKIIPKMFGYKEREYMVVELAKGLTLNKFENVKLSDESVVDLSSTLYKEVYSIYKKTGYVIDDIDCNNLVYCGESNKFKLVDLSAVASFSVAYFAREYIASRLYRLVEGFYHRGWLSGFGLSKSKSIIGNLSSNPELR